MKDKTLILARHAHRDTSEGRERDNGLSEKGKDQARRLSQDLFTHLGEEPPVLLSSPKVRCIQTLLPLADRYGTSVKPMAWLDEQEGSRADFQARVEKFLRWWKQRAADRVVICSHGDWIPEFLYAATGQSLDLRKGAWVEVLRRDGAILLGSTAGL